MALAATQPHASASSEAEIATALSIANSRPGTHLSDALSDDPKNPEFFSTVEAVYFESYYPSGPGPVPLPVLSTTLQVWFVFVALMATILRIKRRSKSPAT